VSGPNVGSFNGMHSSVLVDGVEGILELDFEPVDLELSRHVPEVKVVLHVCLDVGLQRQEGVPLVELVGELVQRLAFRMVRDEIRAFCPKDPQIKIVFLVVDAPGEMRMRVEIPPDEGGINGADEATRRNGGKLLKHWADNGIKRTIV
jgi:hypothetical protein